MARELAIFQKQKVVKHPSVEIELKVNTVDAGYQKGRIIPAGIEHLFVGKVLNRKNEGYKLPHWCEEAVPGSFAKAVAKALPKEKETVSTAPQSHVSDNVLSVGAASSANAGDLV